MLAAIEYASLPPMVVCLSPLTGGTSPTRMTWAPPAELSPVGASSFSAPAVAVGSELGLARRIGARKGDPISEEAATAACQLSAGARVMAVGCVPAAVDGKTARATAAALEIGSLPATRVVFLVAR
jgi:uncharacterized Zn-binding protein involved in type VI secretion